MFFVCEVWCIADVSSVSPSSVQTEELTLETLAIHQTSQAKNISYQPLIKTIFSLLSHSEITRVFSNSFSSVKKFSVMYANVIRKNQQDVIYLLCILPALCVI